jgi:hypothetical protein
VTDVPLPPLAEQWADPDERDALALVLATVENDFAAVAILLDNTDPVRLLAIMSGLAMSFGVVAFGSAEELAAYLREKLAP